jgi:hypothetical protein
MYESPRYPEYYDILPIRPSVVETKGEANANPLMTPDT